MSFKKAFSFSNTSVIQSHLAKHQQILRIILSVSPTQLQPHIKDCVINNNRLMVYVSSAAWASQLRFYSAQIQTAVNTQSKEKIEQIRIRVIAPDPFKIEKQSTKIFPSEENIAFIRNNADTISDSKLKRALLRLSHVLQKHNS